MRSPRNARDTVGCETPAAAAMSKEVTRSDSGGGLQQKPPSYCAAHGL
ncbi:hypothetical protein SPHINGO8AM_150030 [Sphingomonas sp. 8AM]|nr:hypothetical protein SPHINGO8AM_150030 [Sphingomonas sp. 8AM]